MTAAFVDGLPPDKAAIAEEIIFRRYYGVLAVRQVLLPHSESLYSCPGSVSLLPGAEQGDLAANEYMQASRTARTYRWLASGTKQRTQRCHLPRRWGFLWRGSAHERQQRQAPTGSLPCCCVGLSLATAGVVVTALGDYSREPSSARCRIRWARRRMALTNYLSQTVLGMLGSTFCWGTFR